MEKKDSNRRSFFSKIAKLGIVGGISALLLGRISEKTIPPVHGVDLVIDAGNTGSGTTELQSSTSSGAAFKGYATASSGSTIGVLGRSSSTNGRGVEGHADDPGATPLVARGDSGQTANLQEWQSDDETSLTVVDKDGKLGIGTDDPGPMLDIVSGTTGPLNAASSPPGSAPNSFIVENLTSGNHKSQLAFRSNGVNRYSFGNDVSGNGGQDFFIYNEVASTTPFRIDSSDVIHGNFQASDLSFNNGIRATEEGDGLAFKNKAGEKIAVLDDQGNLHIKGKVMEDL